MSVTVVILVLAGYFGYNWYVYGDWLPTEFSKSDPVFRGYDVVEYHNLNDGDKGVKGKKEFLVIYEEAYFWFKNEENKLKFEENPEKYAPGIGAFCTWGL